MPDCICIPKCPFFNDKMANRPATANLMKEKYCKGHFNECARYVIFKQLGREFVPADLFPSQSDRAKEILSGA